MKYEKTTILLNNYCSLLFKYVKKCPYNFFHGNSVEIHIALVKKQTDSQE